MQHIARRMAVTLVRGALMLALAGGPTPAQDASATTVRAVMNSIRNGLGMRKTGNHGDWVDRRARLPVRFSPEFITRSRGLYSKEEE